jgi:Leucine-rich repeat (LRR) protein
MSGYDAQNKSLYLDGLNPVLVEQEIKVLPEYVFEEADDLYLNEKCLQEIPKWLGRFTNLQSINLSSNHIRKLENFESLAKLGYLSIECNHIKKIEGLDTLKNLIGVRFGESYHYRGGNEIHKIENLDSLKKLERLELANNKIQKIEGLTSLQSLKELDLAYNQIEIIEGLEKVSNLKMLNLRDNQIQHLDLSVIPALEQVDLWNNPIKSITGFSELKRIESFIIDPTGFDQSTQDEFRKYFGSLGDGEYYSRIK